MHIPSSPLVCGTYSTPQSIWMVEYIPHLLSSSGAAERRHLGGHRAALSCIPALCDTISALHDTVPPLPDTILALSGDLERRVQRSTWRACWIMRGLWEWWWPPFAYLPAVGGPDGSCGDDGHVRTVPTANSGSGRWREHSGARDHIQVISSTSAFPLHLPPWPFAVSVEAVGHAAGRPHLGPLPRVPALCDTIPPGSSRHNPTSSRCNPTSLSQTQSTYGTDGARERLHPLNQGFPGNGGSSLTAVAGADNDGSGGMPGLFLHPRPVRLPTPWHTGMSKHTYTYKQQRTDKPHS
ncbi:hypothetical protein C8R45DRAFT_946077 [Mycena sanguinolenta]|nr:hypothetical protein C8R45DRAFT_946077 [Mycena sanguinolenta]